MHTGTEGTATTRLRLCFVVESGTDVRMVEGLAERCELTLVTRQVVGGKTISQPTSARFAQETGPSSFMGFAWFTFRRLLRLRDTYDAILVQGYGPAAIAANVVARLLGRPAVMLVCSPVEGYYACRREDRSGKPFRRSEWIAIHVLARLNASIGRQYVVLSRYLERVVRLHGSSGQVAVIPVYGIDTGLFVPPDTPRAQLRGQLGLPLDCALVFFSSRVAPEKDPDTLIEAVSVLRRQGRDVRILHLSGGYEEFLARATAAGLAEAVIARDAVAPFDGLAAYYQASDVCVQASRDEGLGFSVLEALACEVPVVATAVGGLRETIRDGDTGWTYPAGDAVALARALVTVLDGSEHAAATARRGRELVRHSFERHVVFDELVTFLQRQAGAAGLATS